MPDYDLGRAHGEVIITADTSGAQRALADYTAQTEASTKATGDLAKIEEELSKRRQAAQVAAQQRKDAEAEYSRVMKDSSATVAEQVAAEEARNKARGAHLQATRASSDAEKAYRAAVIGNDDAAKKFLRTLDDLGEGHQRSSREVQGWVKELKGAEDQVNKIGKAITSVLMPAIKGMGLASAGGSAGGLLGLLGGGGIQGVVSTLGGATEIVKDFSGALLLLPAVVAGAGAAVGTLAVAFNGVGDALKNMDDPQKFTEALNKLSPAAATVVRTIASFEQSFKGAGQAVQQEFFKPLMDQITPLVQTWLPALMHAGQGIAALFGQMGRAVAQWLEQPAQMAAFQTFIQNLEHALTALMPAMQPILNAFEQLTVVGSSFLPELAQIVDHIATSFNAWVQGASQSGELQAFIQNSIQGFNTMYEIVKNVFEAFSQIGRLSGQNGGVLAFLQQITQEFNNWTRSAQGTAVITEFFKNVHDATTALMPTLKVIGPAFGELLNNLMKTGVAMGPGITSFFQSLAGALSILGQSLVASGPALGQVLTVLGNTLLQIVQQVGPQLPQLFQNFAQALVQLAPAAVEVAKAMAAIMSHLTPDEIETILAIVAAFQAFSAIAPIISGVATAIAFLAANPIVLAIAAVAALVAGVVYAYNEFKEFHDSVDAIWELMKSVASWIGSNFVSIWGDIESAVSAAVTAIVNFPTDVSTAFQDGWTAVSNVVSQWFNDAKNWGVSIVNNLIEGVKSMFQPLTDAASWVASIFSDHLLTKSPAKTGPLHDFSPNQMGQNLAKNFASGVSSGSPEAGSAARSMAGGVASGLGGGGGAPSGGGIGGGAPGGSAVKGGGSSGFEEWVGGLTKDLTDWQKIFKDSFGLFQDVANIFTKSAQMVASIWNGGDNPLTQPGGLFGKPKVVGQQSVDGVPQAQEHGVAPNQQLTPQYWQKKAGAGGDTPAVPQQGVPGVPQAPSAGSVAGPGGSVQGQPPPNGSPATNAGAVGAPPIIVNPDGSISSPDPAWNHLLQRESGGRNIPQGITDSNGGPGSPNAAQGYFQITPDTWKGNGGLDFAPSPMQATAEQQATVAGRIFAARGGQPWGAGSPGRESEDALRAGLGSAQPAPGTGVGWGKGQVPPSAPPGSRPGALAGTFIGPDGVQHVAGPVAPGAAGGPPAAGGATASGTSSVSGAINQNPLQQFLFGGDIGESQQAADQFNKNQAGITRIQQMPADQQKKLLQDAFAHPAPGTAQVQGQQPARPAFVPQAYGLAKGTNTGGYGTGTGATFPQWMMDLGARYGVTPSTYPGHQESDRGGEPGYAPNPNHLNRGVDWTGTPAQMEAFAQALMGYGTGEGGQGGLEQVIYRSQGGREYGLGGAGNDVSGHYYPQSGEGSYDEHATSPGGQGGHVHTRFSTSVPLDLSTAGGPQPGLPTPPQPAPAPGAPGVAQGDTNWIANPPAGWDVTKPVPADVRASHGIPDSMPPIFYTDAKPSLKNVAAVPGSAAPTLQPGQPNLTAPNPQYAPGYQAQPGDNFTGGFNTSGTTQGQASTNQQSPMDQFSSMMGSVGSLAGDSFQVFGDVIKSIGAAADITHTLVRGFANTNDVMKTIDDFQQFITTAADVAKVVGDVGGLVAAGGSGDPTGITGAAGSAVQMAAGLVQDGLQATNAAIDIGQEVWKQFAKYGASFAGAILGNGDTGDLSGNVRMMLNTNTGQFISSSEDNPLNQSVKNLPAWMAASYGGPNPNAQPNTSLAQVNIYAGAGQTPSAMMNESMWLISTGGPAVASVAGQE